MEPSPRLQYLGLSGQSPIHTILEKRKTLCKVQHHPTQSLNRFNILALKKRRVSERLRSIDKGNFISRESLTLPRAGPENGKFTLAVGS